MFVVITIAGSVAPSWSRLSMMTGTFAHVHPVRLVLAATVLHVDRLVRLGAVRVITGGQVDAQRPRGATDRDRHVAPRALRRVGARKLDLPRRKRCVVLLLRVIRHEHLVERAACSPGEAIGSEDRRVRRIGHPQVRVVVDVEPVLVGAGGQRHIRHPVAVAGVRHLDVVAAAAPHEPGSELRRLVDGRARRVVPVTQQLMSATNRTLVAVGL